MVDDWVSMGGIVNIVLKKPKAEGRTLAKVTLGAYGEDLSETAYVQREGKIDKISYLVNLTTSETIKEDRTDVLTDKTALDTNEERDERSKNRSVGLRAKLNFTPSSRLKILYDGSVTFNQDSNDIASTTMTEGSATPTSRYQSHDDATNTMLWSSLGAEHRFGDDIFAFHSKISSPNRCSAHNDDHSIVLVASS